MKPSICVNEYLINTIIVYYIVFRYKTGDSADAIRCEYYLFPVINQIILRGESFALSFILVLLIKHMNQYVECRSSVSDVWSLSRESKADVSEYGWIQYYTFRVLVLILLYLFSCTCFHLVNIIIDTFNRSSSA